MKTNSKDVRNSKFLFQINGTLQDENFNSLNNSAIKPFSNQFHEIPSLTKLSVKTLRYTSYQVTQYFMHQ